MCLNTLWSEEQKNDWLKEQPDMITAYKFVAVRRESIKRYQDGKEKISPPFKMLDEDVLADKLKTISWDNVIGDAED